MGKKWQRFKRYLSENFDRGFKKIVDKFGKFLTTALALSIGVIGWLCGYIDISAIKEFIYGIYIAFVAFSIYSIVEITRKNGLNNNQTKEPQ